MFSLSIKRFLFFITVGVVLSVQAQERVLETDAEVSEQGAQELSNVAIRERVETLLSKSVEYIKANGEEAVVNFANDRQFVDKELYVYGLNLEGFFLASGGDSVALTGDNVLDYSDPNGKLLFKELIDRAKEKSSGEVHYHWFSPGGDITPKTTRYQRVNNLVIAVGYHAMPATEKDARAMLDRAVKAWQTNSADALVSFAELGEFLHDDLYVVVIDRNDGKILVNGAYPEYVGQDGRTIHDEGEHYFIEKMLNMSENQDKVRQVVYRWKNPLSEAVERKHTYFAAENDVIIAVGNYLKEF